MSTDFISLLGIKSSDLFVRRDGHRRLKELDGRFYIYGIWTVGSDGAVPIYIGKGRGKRFSIHLCPSAASDNHIKSRTIAKAQSNGASIRYSIHGSFEIETDAFAEEVRLIALLGRRQRGDGPLTNMTDGGEGMAGHASPRGGDHHRSRPVTAEGITYSSISEACLAVGCNMTNILRRIRRGWPGYYYIDEGQRECMGIGHVSGSASPRARSVVAADEAYATLSSAAHALGVHPPTILKRINAGWPGYYYVDEGQRKRGSVEKWSSEHIATMRLKTSTKRKSVIINGILHKSMSSAAEYLGVSYATVRSRCADDRFQNYTFA